MKRILIAGALALAAAGQAFAADLPPAPAPPPRAPAMYVPVAPPVYNWSGIYIGLNGGYGFGDSTWTVPASSGCVPCTTGSFSTDGFLIGGTAGVNFQAGAFVFGAEADLDWTDIKGTASTTICSCQTSNDWLSTVRGRAGFAMDRVLVFATAGGAFGDVKATSPGAGTESSTEIGWTGGGGVEVALTDNWTAKIEYLYVDLSNGSCTTTCMTTSAAPGSVTFTESLVRAGINFKFGGF
jgi:outer membrane immunogenic protein